MARNDLPGSSDIMQHETAMSAWKPALWGTGQVAIQVYRDVPSLLLLYYMTQLLAIPPAVSGIAIFVPKLLWSTVCDFAVGNLLDRSAIPRRRLLLLGALLVPPTLIALFYPVGGGMSTKLLTIGLVFSCYVTVFSLFSVPHLSIGAEMTAVPAEQSRVMAWRTAFIAVGTIASGSLAPWLIQYRGGGFEGYQFMTFVMAPICSATLILSFLGSREGARQERQAAGEGKWTALRHNKAYRYLLAAYMCQMVGQGASFATLTYLLVFKLSLPAPFAALSMAVLLISISQIIEQPFLIRITNSLGSCRAFMIGSLLYSASLVWLGFGSSGSMTSFYCAAAAIGLTNGMTWQSAFTRLSEVLVHEAEISAERSHAGFYASLFVAGEKVGFALGGTALAGILLGVVGFVPGQIVQSPTAVQGIAMIFCGTPLVFNLIAIALMSGGRLSTSASVPQEKLA